MTMLRAPGSGDVSTMRVVTLFIVVAVVGTWATLSIMKGSFQEMPVELMGLVLGTLGFKAWQRGKE